MAFKDLREFVAAIEQRGWLRRIKARVSPILEIAEITDRVSKSPGGGPALLFENVEGSEVPVLINAFGSDERMCLALGVQRLDDIAREIRSLMEVPAAGGSILDKLGQGMKLLEVARSAAPRTVRSGPVQEVVEEPDLDKLPILQCWPEDGGRYITLPLVFTRDPETGKKNIGMYRMQVYDRKTTGMHWQIHKDGARHQHLTGSGKRMEVAVVLGGDPATIYSASAPLPPAIPELMLAGFLRKQSVELVKCKTLDLEVPAHAEYVLEGYVDTSESRIEGPFGDHTGFYSEAAPYPVFHITTVTRRKNPIYPTIIVGKPPQEDYYLGHATERIFLPLLQMILPEVVDYHMPAEGVFHNCVLVSIKKRYPGQARKVMSGMWGIGLMMLAKLIVVVDADTDVHNYSQVAWRVFNNIDPRRDVVIVDGPVDDLDHASPVWRYGSKMGIDATAKWPSEGSPRPWPAEIKQTEEILEKVTRRWKEYGI